eukprot:360365-Chlamydomonas_euryale.AAC.6
MFGRQMPAHIESRFIQFKLGFGELITGTVTMAYCACRCISHDFESIPGGDWRMTGSEWRPLWVSGKWHDLVLEIKSKCIDVGPFGVHA